MFKTINGKQLYHTTSPYFYINRQKQPIISNDQQAPGLTKAHVELGEWQAIVNTQSIALDRGVTSIFKQEYVLKSRLIEASPVRLT